MKRLLRAAEVLAWSAFFAFALLVLVLRFWVLPNIERWRPEIVQTVSQTIGQPVEIGAIEAGWLGVRPQVTLTDVRVLDAAGRAALVLPVIENVVSWRSIAKANLRLHSLILDRPRLEVRRDAAGAFYVAGIKLAGTKGDRSMADWILDQEDIQVRNAEIVWVDERRSAPPLALSALQFRLQTSGNAHSIGLSARPPAALGSTLELRATLAGHTLADPDVWSGRVYVELGATDLAGWRRWIDYPVDLREGQGAVRMWTTLERGQPRQATADVELARVRAHLGKELPPLALASVRGRIQVSERDGAYEFGGRQLAMTPVQGAAMSPSDFRVSWRPSGGGREEGGALTASLLELEPLAQLADSLPFPVEVRRVLADLAPRGRVLDAKVDWTGPLNAPSKYAARARFSELGLRAREHLPGFSGLSGSVDATEARGVVHLASRNAQIDLPRIMTKPRFPLETLNGELSWARRGKQVSFQLATLAFANPHAEGRASGTYLWSGEGPGVIDLQLQVPRADGRFVADYLPVPQIPGPDAHGWLLSSILAGEGTEGRMHIKGDLKDWPFVDPKKNLFQFTFRVQKGLLDYANGWPRIQDVDANVSFQGERMELNARSGTIYGVRLANVRAVIPKMGKGSHLEVAGTAEGPTGDFLRYIEQSPVRKMTDGLTDGMSAQGRGRLRLKFELPLERDARAKLEGDYELAQNNVTLHPQLPPLERVSGRFSFTDSSFTLHEVRGRFLGGAVAMSGGTRPNAGVEIVAKGDATMAGIGPLFDHPWRKHLTGGTTYTATAGVRDGRARLTFESSLRGVASALPAPLAKNANDALPVRLEFLPSDSGTRDRMSLSLGRLAAAEFLRRRQGEQMVVQRAAVWLTPNPDQAVRVPERPGTLVYGSLPALDLDRWLPLLEGDGTMDSLALDVKVGTLDAYGKRLHDFDIRAGADAAGWSATVAARELAGDLSYRREKGGHLIARLAHFTVPEDYPGAVTRKPGETRELPSVDLAAERFAWRGKQLGKVELLARRMPDAWRIDRISMVNTDAWLAGKGQWQVAPASQTTLTFDLESGDAGQFLTRVGYPDLVRGGKARVQAQLSWAGDPTLPDYASMAGNVQMQAENGQFLEIEPGIGKLVSLMSLQALPRRLSLDFRDVFSKGFQFDRIAANAQIKQGMMALKEFRMRGSAADVEMTGEVDLARETQSLHVRVVPNLGDSASTVIGLINPLLAFPAAIAQRILKDPLGHIFAFNYTVTGTWADPKVERTRVDARPVQEPVPSAGGQ